MTSDSPSQTTPMHPTTESGPHKTVHFYQNDQLATELARSGNRHVFWAIGKALAQLEQPKNARILQVDDANSVIGALTGADPEFLAYPPYGYLTAAKMLALIGFNGKWQDPASLAYLLGNGHRSFHTSIGRFGIADTLSPFGKGGVNSYAYCAGDPINREDSTGRWFGWIRNKFNKTPTYNTIGKLLNQGKSLPNLAIGISEKIDTSLPSYRQALAEGGWPGVRPPKYTKAPNPRQTTNNINLGVVLTPIEKSLAIAETQKLKRRIDYFKTHTPLFKNPELRRMEDILGVEREELIITHRRVLAIRQNTAS